MNMIRIDVTAHPFDPSVVQNTKAVLEELRHALYANYQIDLPIETANLARISPEWPPFLCRVVEASINVKRGVSSMHLYALLEVASNPIKEVIQTAELTVGTGNDFLKPYIDEAANRSADLRPVPQVLFMALPNIPLSIGRGMWGECCEKYPRTVALEVTGHRESVFHECLHQFGLSEGYDPKTRHTSPECDNCWMQYQPTKGSGLCETHLLELVEAVGKLGG